MSTTKITERNLDEKFLQNLYTKDNPPTASNVGAVAESDLATAIQSLIDSGVIEVGEKAYTPSSNLLETIWNKESTALNAPSGSFYLGKYIPKKSGAIKIECSVKSGTSASGKLIIGAPNLATGTGLERINKAISILESAEAGTIMSNDNFTLLGYLSIGGYLTTFNYKSYTTLKIVFPVEKGVPVYFLLQTESGSNFSTQCNSVKLYADEV